MTGEHGTVSSEPSEDGKSVSKSVMRHSLLVWRPETPKVIRVGRKSPIGVLVRRSRVTAPK
jgi:hypothetical protein